MMVEAWGRLEESTEFVLQTIGIDREICLHSYFSTCLQQQATEVLKSTVMYCNFLIFDW